MTDDALFARALAHVLAMEGGYTEDQYDPGGPTNLGITLAEFARDKGVAVTADTFAQLKAELKALPASTAARIYRTRYWEPARCPDLPPPLAFFHFDAAVNQGVGAAARMLQEAVGAAVDGVVGADTLAKAAAEPVAASLARYADIRRRRYRALATFWRFGKGWLARVDRTLATASALPSALPFTPPPQPKETPTMTDRTQPAPVPVPAPVLANGNGAKWWGSSMTIWGVIVTGLSTVLPVIGPLFGLNVTADLVQQLGDQIVLVAQAVGGLVGTIMAIYGRARATTSLERRKITMTM
jgi:lysozyme family protein